MFRISCRYARIFERDMWKDWVYVKTGANEETTYHALIECMFAIVFWAAMETAGVKLPLLRPNSWALDLLDDVSCNEEDASIILCGTWSLWTSKNARKHGEAQKNLFQLCIWARDTAFDIDTILEVIPV